MAVYVYNKDLGYSVNKVTGERMNAPDAPLAAPMTFSDTPGYASPIDGKWIEGRKARKYDLQSNNCVDPETSGKPRGFKNERFAKKRGLEHLLT